MQLTKLVQAVILMIIVALAANCATAKSYTSRLFGRPADTNEDSLSIKNGIGSQTASLFSINLTLHTDSIKTTNSLNNNSPVDTNLPGQKIPSNATTIRTRIKRS